MTSMPDLRPTGWSASLPLGPARTPRPAAPEPSAAPLLEPQAESASRRAESRRIVADRYELQTQQRTAESVKEVLSQTSREVGPRFIDVRRLSKKGPTSGAEASRRDAEVAQDRLDATNELVSETRAAAARLTAQRISLQTQAAKVADEAQADARSLADVNGELTAPSAPTTARRAELSSDQRQLVDRLVESTGASVAENKDGSVDLRLGDRPLVQGGTAATLEVTRPDVVSPPPSTTTAPAPDDTPAPGTPVLSTPPSPAPAQPDPDNATSLPGTATATPPAPSDAPSSSDTPASPKAPTTPLVGTPVADDSAASPASPAAPGAQDLEIRWSDGQPAQVGGTLGGMVAADRDILRPAITGLDQVAASIAVAVNASQTAGTTPTGAAGQPLLTGDSALSLRIVPGATAEDIAFGAPLGEASPAGSVPGAAAAMPTATPETPTPLATGSIPGLGTPLTSATPEDQLAELTGQSLVTAGTLGRKAEVVSAFDASSGAASARLGQHLSAALGAIGEVAGSDMVTALTQANSAMTFAGAAARRAIADGIPVVVGSSDPSVATAAGTLPLDAAPSGLLHLNVMAVAGDGSATPTGAPPIPGMPASGLPGEADPALTVPGTGMPAGAGTPADPGAVSPRVGVAPEPGLPATDADGVIGGAVPLTGQGAGAVPGAGVPGGESSAAQPGQVTGLPGQAAPVPAPGDAAPEGVDPALAGRTRAVVGGVEVTSATRVLSGVQPGIDVTVHQPGQATLAVTPDPGPALGRVQSLVDAVGKVAAAVEPSAAALPSGAAGQAAGAAAAHAAAKTGIAGVFSTLSTFAASFSPSAAAAGAAPTGVSAVLGAVATPLVSAMGTAFVDASGAPVVPGTSVQRGRVSLDREAFAHEYVKDAVSVENAIASVARSVSATADAASDPRIGALAVRIQGQMGFDAEYTLDQTQADERIDARRDALDRKSTALQSLLEHLEDESSWLGAQLR